jgi:hypothetical protein
MEEKREQLALETLFNGCPHVALLAETFLFDNSFRMTLSQDVSLFPQ